jgi:hypothetical protein
MAVGSSHDTVGNEGPTFTRIVTQSAYSGESRRQEFHQGKQCVIRRMPSSGILRVLSLDDGGAMFLRNVASYRSHTA